MKKNYRYIHICIFWMKDFIWVAIVSYIRYLLGRVWIEKSTRFGNSKKLRKDPPLSGLLKWFRPNEKNSIKIWFNIWFLFQIPRDWEIGDPFPLLQSFLLQLPMLHLRRARSSGEISDHISINQTCISLQIKYRGIWSLPLRQASNFFLCLPFYRFCFNKSS